MKHKNINLPFTNEIIKDLKCGEKLMLNGYIITARDAAHKRISDINENISSELNQVKLLEILGLSEPIPSTVYYSGPTPAKQGFASGASGPTTSGRMDNYTKLMLDLGINCFIGKGVRSVEVMNLLKKYNALYLIAIGGAGALYGSCIDKSECIAFEDLGSEAIYRLRITNFPCYVGICP